MGRPQDRRSRKLLNEMQLLAGQQEDISLTDLRASIGDVIAQVEQGKTFRIMRKGRAVAQIGEPELTAIDLGSAVRKLGLVGS